MIPNGGLNLWITLPIWIDTNQLLIEAKKNFVSFLPGSVCFPVEQEKCHLRLSFSFMSEQQLQQGIKTLCMIFNAEISSKKNNTPDF